MTREGLDRYFAVPPTEAERDEFSQYVRARFEGLGVRIIGPSPKLQVKWPISYEVRNGVGLYWHLNPQGNTDHCGHDWRLIGYLDIE